MKQLIMTKAEFNDATNNITNYSKNFDNFIFSEFNMSSCLKKYPFSFTKCVFNNIFFDNASIENINFTNCTFNNCYFNQLILTGIEFVGCVFSQTKFCHIMFCYSKIIRCDMPKSNIFYGCSGVDLILSDDINKLNFRYENSPIFSPLCPEYGDSLVGYKKAYYKVKEKSEEYGITQTLITPCIVKLFIPKDALRSNSTGRKCRCNKAKVLSITTLDGKLLNSDIIAISSHDPLFYYEKGKTLTIDDFDENRWNECAPGIHFFLTKNEAIDY